MRFSSEQKTILLDIINEYYEERMTTRRLFNIFNLDWNIITTKFNERLPTITASISDIKYHFHYLIVVEKVPRAIEIYEKIKLSGYDFLIDYNPLTASFGNLIRDLPTFGNRSQNTTTTNIVEGAVGPRVDLEISLFNDDPINLQGQEDNIEREELSEGLPDIESEDNSTTEEELEEEEETKRESVSNNSSRVHRNTESSNRTLHSLNQLLYQYNIVLMRYIRRLISSLEDKFESSIRREKMIREYIKEQLTGEVGTLRRDINLLKEKVRLLSGQQNQRQQRQGFSSEQIRTPFGSIPISTPRQVPQNLPRTTFQDISSLFGLGSVPSNSSGIFPGPF